MPDPAEVARERSQRIQGLLGEAAQAESDALEYADVGDATAEHLALTLANNRRLQAVCEHLNLRPLEEDTDVD